MDSNLIDSFLATIKAMKELGIGQPVYIMLPSKHSAVKLVRQIDFGSNPSSNGSSAIESIEAGAIHSFMLFGVEFCWPADPPLDNVVELKKSA